MRGNLFRSIWTVHVEPDSDLVFTNFAFTSAFSTDPDAQAINEAFNSGEDILDQLAGANNNFPIAEFPIPVQSTTPTTTLVSAPGNDATSAAGTLSTTGSNVVVLGIFAVFLIFAGCGVALASRNRRRLM
jgi:hypothetical protein